jgi:hypothetical protein
MTRKYIFSSFYCRSRIRIRINIESGSTTLVQMLAALHLTRGEILRPPGSSLWQTIVFRYKEIRGILCTKHLRNGNVSF